jgi:hypothetical protein
VALSSRRTNVIATNYSSCPMCQVYHNWARRYRVESRLSKSAQQSAESSIYDCIGLPLDKEVEWISINTKTRRKLGTERHRPRQ